LPGRNCAWQRLAFANPDIPVRSVDLRACALCVLEVLLRGLRRRDVYATGSLGGRPRPAAGRLGVGQATGRR